MELIVSWLDGKETIECNFNQSFFRSFKALDNKVVLKEIRAHLTDLATQHLTI